MNDDPLLRELNQLQEHVDALKKRVAKLEEYMTTPTTDRPNVEPSLAVHNEQPVMKDFFYTLGILAMGALVLLGFLWIADK